MKLTKKDIAFPLMGEGYIEVGRLREVVKELNIFQKELLDLDKFGVSKPFSEAIYMKIIDLFGEVMEWIYINMV